MSLGRSSKTSGSKSGGNWCVTVLFVSLGSELSVSSGGSSAATTGLCFRSRPCNAASELRGLFVVTACCKGRWVIVLFVSNWRSVQWLSPLWGDSLYWRTEEEEEEHKWFQEIQRTNVIFKKGKKSAGTETAQGEWEEDVFCRFIKSNLGFFRSSI